jgi:hypothetical protein
MSSLSQQHAYKKAMEAYRLCEAFASDHELPTEYVWQEFVDPTVASLKAVTKALDVNSLLVYH